ncbi:regulatory GntR family protein [Streptomyces sp. 3212.3]|nr:regulatory GntR family protein [Streptomyces sp. 3212.3]
MHGNLWSSTIGVMDLDRTRPLWRQIAAEIIRRIEGGVYPPGSRVPSTLEIAQEFGVVNATAAKAMRHVREQGYTRGEVGLGTFVADSLPTGDG